MLTTEEISLMERLRSGNQDALKTLYTRYFTTLTRIATGLGGENVHAKDVVQNAFIQLWNKRQTLQIDTSILSYLRRMVVNEILALQRKAGRRRLLRQKQLPSKVSHTDVEDVLLTQEAQSAIHKAIDNLPDRCSEIFKLSRYSELTYQEIADTLDLSVKTVENQMGKALKILRDELKVLL